MAPVAPFALQVACSAPRLLPVTALVPTLALASLLSARALVLRSEALFLRRWFRERDRGERQEHDETKQASHPRLHGTPAV
jgi:hypothetical protein